MKECFKCHRKFDERFGVVDKDGNYICNECAEIDNSNEKQPKVYQYSLYPSKDLEKQP